MNDPELRAYLLGRMAEAEAQTLEERLLEDEELFETLHAVEDDLVDDYAGGRLDPADLEAFARRYAGRTDRVRFSRALAQSATRGNVVAWPRRTWVPFAVAATVILGLGVPLLMNRPVHAPTGVPAGRSTPSPASGGEAVTLSVVIASSRSDGPRNSVILPATATSLNLRVAVDPGDRFDRYQVELHAPSGAMAYRGADLRAASDGSVLTLLIEVPARSLNEGAHELAVVGIDSQGEAEPLGFATIHIRRSP